MLVVLAAVTAATGARFRNGLVWDDWYSIGSGSVIHDFSEAGAIFRHPTLYVTTVYRESDRRPVDTYRPITLLTFMIDSAISGRDPVAYHATNLLGHLACVLLVFFLARSLLPTRRAKYAPFAAAWFGLSPLLAEAEVWINGRSDVFCALFGLGALLAWRAGVRTGRARRSQLAMLALACALFLLASLSKEVILLGWPAFVLWPRRDDEGNVVGLGPERGLWRRHLVGLVPFALASVAYTIMRVEAIEGVRAAGDLHQLLVALGHLPVLLADGLFQSIVPTRVYIRSMVDDYAVFGAPALGAFGVLLVVFVGMLVRIRRRVPLLVWSLLWFASTLAPAAVISTLLWPGFGRYLYVPMAGLVIGLTDMLGARPRAKARVRPRDASRSVRVSPRARRAPLRVHARLPERRHALGRGDPAGARRGARSRMARADAQ